jgi:hypothetical protein
MVLELFELLFLDEVKTRARAIQYVEHIYNL